MKTHQKILALLLAGSFWAIFSTGCNTMNGAGKDIERAGEKIQEKSGK